MVDKWEVRSLWWIYGNLTLIFQVPRNPCLWKCLQTWVWYVKISTFLRIQQFTLESFEMFCKSLVWNQCYNVPCNKLHVIWMKVAHYLLSMGFGIGVNKVGWSGSVSDLYSGCTWFESWLRCFMAYNSLFANSVLMVWTVPHAFEFMKHDLAIIHCYIAWPFTEQVGWSRCVSDSVWACQAQNGTLDINCLDWCVS
jgi:hypothetical protein